MKRLISVLLVLALSLSLGAGCSQKSDSPASSAPPSGTASQAASAAPSEASKEPVEISFWHGETQPERVAGFQSVIDEFQKQNPHITVTQSATSNAEIFNKLVTALSTNTNPEMSATTPERTMAFRNLGYGVAVDDLVAEIDAQHKYASENPKNLYRFDGHYWSVPLWSITIMLYYREDLLKAAGFDSPPQTWDELLEVAEKLTGGGNYGIALPASSGQNCTDQVVWSFLSTNQGDVFNDQGEIVFNNPKNLETYEYLQKLAKFSPADCTGWSWAETKLAFTSGKAAMAPLFGSILIDLEQQAEFADQVKAISFPVAPSGARGGNTHTEGMVIFTEDAAKQAACQDFIRFFMSEDIYGKSLADMQPGLFLPVTETGMNTAEYYEQPTNARFRSIIESELEQVKTGSLFGFRYDKRNEFVGEIGVSYLLGGTLQQIVSGAMAPAAALEWGESKMIELTQ